MIRYRFIFLLISIISTGILLQAQNSYHVMLDNLLSGTVPVVTVEDLKSQPENIILLDTRERNEFKVSHLAGAKWVGYDHFDLSSVSDIPKDQLIVTYCSVGYRSEKIGEQLMKNGYKNVYNLYGGIFEWVNNGEKVVDMKNNETGKVHAYDIKWGVWLKKGIKTYE